MFVDFASDLVDFSHIQSHVVVEGSTGFRVQSEHTITGSDDGRSEESVCVIVKNSHS